MRLIDADALKDAIEDNDNFVGGSYDIIKVVDAQPTILPKRGKWILDGHHVQCDQCGIYMCNTDREGDPIPRFFCSSCGADMREVTE